MIQEIPFKSLTTTPDDYLAQDGELSYCLNLTHKEGSITTTPTDTLKLYIPEGYKLLYIHKTLSYNNYIFLHTKQEGIELCYATGDEEGSILHSLQQHSSYIRNIYLTQTDIPANSEEITSAKQAIEDIFEALPVISIADLKAPPTQITSVGNALCILTDTGIRTALWKEGTYNALPAALPIPQFTANLVGYYKTMRYEQDVLISKNVKDKDFFDYLTSHSIEDYLIPDNSHTPKEKIILTPPSYMDNFAAGNYKFLLTPPIWQDYLNWEYTDLLFKAQIFVGTKIGNEYSWTEIQLKEINEKHPTWYYDLIDKGYTGSGFSPVLRTAFYIKTEEACDAFAIVFDKTEVNRVDRYYTAAIDLYTNNEYSNNYIIVDNDTTNSRSIVSAAAKKFIFENSTIPKRFIYPFFLKVAFKTQDNKYICPSAPVLLIPNAGMSPVVRLGNIPTEQTEQINASLLLSALFCDLSFMMPNRAEYEAWDSIISKVVISISQPIYSYNQGIEDKTELQSAMFIENYMTDYNKFSIASINGNPPQQVYEHQLFSNTNDYKHIVHLPMFDSAEDKMMQDPDFFVIKEIPFQDIINNKWETEQILKLDKISFESVVNQTKLPDDYSSLNQYIPKTAYAFNGRLHIANYQQEIFAGWHPNQFIQPTTKRYFYKAFVYIKQDNQTYMVEQPFDATPEANLGELRYFSYPDINAYKAVIYQKRGDEEAFYKAELDLKSHPLRNEAYWFNEYNTIMFEPYCSPDNNPEQYQTMLMEFFRNGYKPAKVLADRSNYLKISEPNNPLYFTNLRTYAFSSDIIAIRSAVTALSTGQKGDFDLYIFTDSDGVWTLKINNEGGYSHQIPVTPDTLSNPDSLCQLNGSLLFATTRGVMQLIGSQATCISEELNNYQFIQPSDSHLPDITALTDGFKTLDIQDTELDFKNYIQSAIIVQDYRNQRILIFDPKKKYAYARSIQSPVWYMLPNSYRYQINSYPDTLLAKEITIGTDTLNIIANICSDQHTETCTRIAEQEGFLLTRPFSLSSLNDFKTIDQLRINGTANTHHIQTILYGSNDLLLWSIISSSTTGRISGRTGTPYRFFRLAIAAKLLPTESIDSFSVAYYIKNENIKLF